jgi:hypothetical protein
MQIILARIISVVFHPVIMPPLGLLLLFNSGTYLDFLSFPQKRAIFMILFTGTTILPLSVVPVMLLQKMITSLKMENHRERVLPLMITSIFYGFTWFTLSRLNVPGLISTYSITACLTVLLCAIVSVKWMISLHMTALGAVTGMLLAIGLRFNINLLAFLIFAILLSGIAGWARLSLKAHTPAQIYVGYLSGTVLSFFMIYNF